MLRRLLKGNRLQSTPRIIEASSVLDYLTLAAQLQNESIIYAVQGAIEQTHVTKGGVEVFIKELYTVFDNTTSVNLPTEPYNASFNPVHHGTILIYHKPHESLGFVVGAANSRQDLATVIRSINISYN